jgi:hypothetical protein
MRTPLPRGPFSRCNPKFNQEIYREKNSVAACRRPARAIPLRTNNRERLESTLQSHISDVRQVIPRTPFKNIVGCRENRYYSQ